jgi:hypothetical protein
MKSLLTFTNCKLLTELLIRNLVTIQGASDKRALFPFFLLPSLFLLPSQRSRAEVLIWKCTAAAAAAALYKTTIKWGEGELLFGTYVGSHAPDKK